MVKPKGPDTTRTIIDVLDDTLGGEWAADRAQNLTDDEIDHLAQNVGEFCESWEPPKVDEGLRVYSGGWIAGNLGPSRDYLLTSLIYAPSVVIHDPVAEWFDPHRGRFTTLPGIPSLNRNASGEPAMTVSGDEPTRFMNADGFHGRTEDRYNRTRVALGSSLAVLADLHPLIRAGIVVPVPELTLLHKHQDEILSAVRFDVRDEHLATLIRTLTDQGDPPARGNLLRGMEATPTGGMPADYEIRAVVQNPAYYFHKTAMLAASLDAHYVPPAGADAALMEFRLRQLGQRLDTKTNHNTEM